MANSLEIFTVYSSPSDYPGKFVVRRWQVKDGGTEADAAVLATGDTLQEVRKQVPNGLVCMTRHPSDDPVIVETWI